MTVRPALASVCPSLNYQLPVTDKSSWAHLLLVGFFMFWWIVSSVLGVIVQKQLVGSLNYPLTITTVHLAAATLFDLTYLKQQRHSIIPQVQLLQQSIPVGSLLAITKVLTYISYGHIPASLVHTLKSSAPIFGAFVTWMYWGTIASFKTNLSLIVIAIGVTLATVTEVHFELLGFTAALLSTLLSVLQVTAIKHILQKSPTLEIFFLHFHCSLIGLVFMLPIALFFDGNAQIEAIFSDTQTTPFPFGLFAFSIIIQYLQTTTSTVILSQVSLTTHQVSGTFKRLIVIVSSMWYFETAATLVKVIGIGMSLLGFLSYALWGKQERKKIIEIGDPHELDRLKSSDNELSLQV